MTSKVETHAESELRRAGLFDKDSDYGGAVGEAVMKLVRVFAAEGHSGASAQLTIAAFELVARFKALTPLTSDPAEWNNVTSYTPSTPTWQNVRQSSCISRDGGLTYMDVDEPRLDGVDATIHVSDPPHFADCAVYRGAGCDMRCGEDPEADDERDDGPGIETTDEGC